MIISSNNKITQNALSNFAQTYLNDRVKVLEFFYSQDYCFYGEFKHSPDVPISLDEGLSHIKAIEIAINEHYFGRHWREQQDKFWVALFESLNELTNQKIVWFVLRVPQLMFSQVDEKEIANLVYTAFQSQTVGHFVDGKIEELSRSKNDLDFFQAYNYILDEIVDPMHFITKVLRNEVLTTENCIIQ